MKKTLSKTVNLCMGLLLVSSFSCSNQEDLLESNETLIVDNDESLTARTNGQKISGCNNPKGFRIYTVGELGGLSDGDDYVPKKADNGTNVDIMRDIDDRTCAYNYSQEKRGDYEYGKYRLRANSNSYDNLEPRIERASLTTRNTTDGFVRVSGFVRIRKVGDGTQTISDNNQTNINNQSNTRESSGTYIMQAKGTHTGGGGSADPAILLLLAKPANNGDFNIYSEQITKRGGSGASGRDVVFITKVKGDRRIFVSMTNRFSNGKQRIDYKIGSVRRSFEVPESSTQKGQTAKIRFGAYRCKAGEADIWWSDITHNHKK